MTDSIQNLICPACGTEMTKVLISDKGFFVDICTQGCGGMFFDNKEIREFSGQQDDISEIKSAIENKNFMPVDETKPRICPVCNTPMAKTNALGVKIDTCYNCGGLFLDNGEFEQIRTHFKKPAEKVKPVNIDYEKINMNEFLNYEQQNHSYGALNFFLNVLFTPIRHRRNRFF